MLEGSLGRGPFAQRVLVRPRAPRFHHVTYVKDQVGRIVSGLPTSCRDEDKRAGQQVHEGAQGHDGDERISKILKRYQIITNSGVDKREFRDAGEQHKCRGDGSNDPYSLRASLKNVEAAA